MEDGTMDAWWMCVAIPRSCDPGLAGDPSPDECGAGEKQHHEGQFIRDPWDGEGGPETQREIGLRESVAQSVAAFAAFTALTSARPSGLIGVSQGAEKQK